MEGDSTSEMWRVEVGGEETSAVFTPATGSPISVLFVCAHGAGGSMNDGAMEALSRALGARGFDLVHFNFLYREQGSRRPDPMPRLKACIAAVAEHARREHPHRKLVLGGRSMGGRAASMLVADGYTCDGLVLLAYPLHPAGKPDELRAAHLARIRVPVLCMNGTRDALCRRDLMERTLETVDERWTMRWLEGADHGFHVLRRSGRDDKELLIEVATTCSEWAARLP